MRDRTKHIADAVCTRVRMHYAHITRPMDADTVMRTIEHNVSRYRLTSAESADVLVRVTRDILASRRGLAVITHSQQPVTPTDRKLNSNDVSLLVERDGQQ